MKRLKAITAITAAAATMPLAACTTATATATGSTATGSSTGLVTGRLLLEGGPLRPGGRQPGRRPIPGTVEFTVGHRRPVTARANSSGTFSVTLAAGTYNAQASSPRVTEVSDGTARQTPCSQPLTVTVTARHTTRITLACIVP
jgi:hypothetical protein